MLESNTKFCLFCKVLHGYFSVDTRKFKSSKTPRKLNRIRGNTLNQGDINPANSFEQSRVGKRQREEEAGDGDMNTIG